ncbi:MAG: hypothetical protein JNL43_16740 [Flavobacteriales bacterium]|nr:hypothetical protein [Flavobacteriales bacterium]
MNHRTLLPALLLGGLLVACVEKKPAVVSTPAPSQPTRTTTEARKPEKPVEKPGKPVEKPAGKPVEKPGKEVRLGGAGLADSLFFTLQKTPCFGSCKAYTINVYRSGYATFDGSANVEKIGKHQGYVGKDTLQVLLKSADDFGLYGMKDRYDSNVTDLPSSIIRVVANGKDKKVIGRVGSPETFTRFVTKAEGLLYPIAWKPVPVAR